MIPRIEAAVAAIAPRFESANRVPVQKATVPREEWLELMLALMAAAPSQPEGAEPEEWQYRMRPGWETKPRWTEWKECSAASAAAHQKYPVLHDWHYETRALYLHPSQSAGALPKAVLTEAREIASGHPSKDARAFAEAVIQSAGAAARLDAAEIWALAQLGRKEGMQDAIERIEDYIGQAGVAAPDEGKAWQPIESVPATTDQVLLLGRNKRLGLETGHYARNIAEVCENDGGPCPYTHWAEIRSAFSAPKEKP